MTMSKYQTLEERISTVIRTGDTADEEHFCELALDVYRFQRRSNDPYDKYCQQLGTADAITDWRLIPAAPQQAFKRFGLRAFPEAETARTFRTSGTTGEGYGSHHFRSLRLYEESILAGWRYFGLPTDLPQLVLTLTPEQAPYSSLSHMMGTLSAVAAQESQTYCLREDGSLDFNRFVVTATGCQQAQQPFLLLGTALAFLHLFEALAERQMQFTLPAGSQAMETGGYKGSVRTLAKEELYALFEACLGLSARAVINEYGMTELSSPFYTRGLDQPHCGTPWTRALIIDPETGNEAAHGEVGVVRLFDLANLGSVVAIQTQDLAVAAEDGGFVLLGRDPAALTERGCSRSADEMLRGAALQRARR